MDAQRQADLIENLSSAEPSIRLQAIEQCLAEADSETLVSALVQRQSLETDAECQILLGRAIVGIRQRLAGAPPMAGAADAEMFLEYLGRAEPTDRLAAWSSLSPRVARAVAPKAPQLIESETDPLVRAAIIRACGRSWPRDGLRPLGALIGSDSVSVRTAALEALAQIAPESLQRQLPQLLVSRDPRIRTLAIRGLATLDLDEAINHLHAMLTTGTPATKLAGLQACLYLPFEAVKSTLLHFLTVETQPGLLQRAGWLFEINPDPEVPYRLYELAETLPAQRAQVIRLTLNGACKVLQASGLVEGGFEPYLARLKAWIATRQVAVRLQEALAALEQGEAPSAELEAVITRAIQDERLRPLFVQARSWPMSPATRQIFDAWLAQWLEAPSDTGTAVVAAPTQAARPNGMPEAATAGQAASVSPTTPSPAPPGPAAAAASPTSGPPTAAAPAMPATSAAAAAPPVTPATQATAPAATAPSRVPAAVPGPSSGPPTARAVPPTAVRGPASLSPAAPVVPVERGLRDFEQLAPDQRVRLIGSLIPEDAGRATDRLTALLTAPGTPTDLLAAALRAAGRLGLVQFATAAEAALKTDDIAQICAAVEYLGTLHPDAFFPRIGKYLQHTHPRVKSTALKLLQHVDGQQAVSMLKAMLASRVEEQRTAAFACMMNFNFALIRPILVEFLAGQVSEREFAAGLCLFQANPDRGNLYELFRLERLLAGRDGGKVAAVRKATEKFLVECGQLKAAEAAQLDAQLAQRYAKEQEKQAKPAPDYALSRLAPESGPRWQDAFREYVAEFVANHFRPLAIAGAVIAVLIMLRVLMSLSFGGGTATTPSRRQEPRVIEFAQPAAPSQLAVPVATPTTGATDLPLPGSELFVAPDRRTSEDHAARHAERAAAGAKALDQLAEKTRNPSARFGEDAGQ